MAITDKLSRSLHHTLGEEAADEMVDWMNRIDAQRAELRDLNELNFSRIDARFAQIDARFNEIDARFNEFDARLGKMDADLRREMQAGFARLELKIEQRAADMMKWSFVFWVGSVLTITGALTALSRFLP